MEDVDREVNEQEVVKLLRSKWYPLQWWLSYGIALAAALTVASGFFSLNIVDIITSSPPMTVEGRITQLEMKLDGMIIQIESLENNLMIMPQLLSDTSVGVLPVEMKQLGDSLRAVSGRVKQLTDAITPQSMTEIITLQRLGDRYEQLTQSIKDLKSDIEKSQLSFERMLRNHATRVDSELDRFSPMIWGMLCTIVLIVIQNLWTQRRKEPNQSSQHE